MTPTGFYSAVQHQDDPDLLLVRTRVRRDALRLAQFVRGDLALSRAPSVRRPLPMADYPWRLAVPRETWAHFLLAETESITYPNFKDEVAQHDPVRVGIYHYVWELLSFLEGLDPHGRRL